MSTFYTLELLNSKIFQIGPMSRLRRAKQRYKELDQHIDEQGVLDEEEQEHIVSELELLANDQEQTFKVSYC